jgi:hypothetical protein
MIGEAYAGRIGIANSIFAASLRADRTLHRISM